jgi:hypothetical protein
MLPLYELYINPSNNRSLNAPEFIYSILHNTNNPSRIRGRTLSHPEKIINSISIDKAIPNKAFKDLQKIKQIETRASCQGTDDTIKPTFLIFRFKEDKPESYIKSFCKKLEDISLDPPYLVGYNLGSENKYRIGVTSNIFYSPDNQAKFDQWWLELPNRIKKAL